MHTAANMLSINECSNQPFLVRRDPWIYRWMDETRSHIDEHLNQLLRTTTPSSVAEAMHYSVLAPGKRVRPLLMLSIANFLGVSPPGLMKAACVIEMVHSASLVLDDLPCMDNDRERRNRLATHAKFGEDLSILAAVSLLMKSHCLLATDDSIEAHLRLKLIQLFCDTIGSSGLSLGQYIDLHATQRVSGAFSVEDVHHLKTGILFVAAAKAACLLCNATPAQEASIIQFTTNLGLAFQARDDLSDRDDGQSNLVTEIGFASARRRYHDYIDAAHGAIDGEPNAAALQDFAAAMLHSQPA
jgi:geranylgeranyl diphosphate synthase type II